MRGRAVLLSCVILAGSGAGWADAPAAPSTDEIIQQLRGSGRTRGMRNLVVEEVKTETAAPAAPPEGGRPAALPVGGYASTPAPTVAEREEPPPSISLQIQFGFASAQVQPQSIVALRNLASALRSPELSAASFTIEGHTDGKGDPQYNLVLSQRRADAVRALLAQYGVEPVRLVSIGKGSTQLANPRDPLDGINRRVRVVARD